MRSAYASPILRYNALIINPFSRSTIPTHTHAIPHSIITQKRDIITPSPPTHAATFALIMTAKKKNIIDKTPWTYHFSRYLGRKLTPAETAVIAPLEKARHYRHARPTIIIDPPGRDSSELLLSYLHYRLGPDCKPGLLYIPNRLDFLYRHPRLPKHIAVNSARNVNHARGSSPFCILMLNVEQYKTASPLYRNTSRWNALCRTVWPMFTPWGFLIIHIRQTRRDPGFPEVLTRIMFKTPPKSGDDDDLTTTVIVNPDAPPDIPIIIFLPPLLPPPAPSHPRRG